MRMTLFAESAMKTLPDLSITKPWGTFNWAAVAGPPSPEYPARDVPAISVRTPVVSILNTEFELLKYTLPEASMAVRRGCPMAVPAAATGVAGGTPPANVEIVYCWAGAREAPDKT